MFVPDKPDVYQGKQVIINSDRLLFNAKTDSILLFSNKVIGFSTNGSFHFDTSPNEESKFVVNSPKIYLGLEYDDTLPTQPAVLGEELTLQEILPKQKKTRCCGRCDGVSDICYADLECEAHYTLGCRICWPDPE